MEKSPGKLKAVMVKEKIKITPIGQTALIGKITPDGTQAKQVQFNNIQIKFQVNSKTQIPAGIPEQERGSDAQVDKRHFVAAYQGGYGHLAAPGRLREDRVDTGKNFINNLQRVQIGCIMKGLSNHDYHLSKCFWYHKPDASGDKRKDKYVVVLELGLGADALVLSRETTLQRRELASVTWMYCHGWANPDGRITLNFGGRMDGAKAQHAVVVRNGALTAARITENVNESEESE
jgi:hypothetical protein